MAHKQTQRPHNVVLYDIALSFFFLFQDQEHYVRSKWYWEHTNYFFKVMF